MRKMGLSTIYKLAKNNENIIFIGSDLGLGTLEEFKNTLPKQFFMEGISESNVLGMAAGMAMEGDIVFVNSIASFLLRRSYEQLALDICAENVNVRIFGNGGGLVYGPLGHSHTMVDDFSLLRSLDNLVILAPADSHEMENYIKQSETFLGPIYFRLGKGGDKIVTSQKSIEIGKAQLFSNNNTTEILIITTGVMLQRAMEVMGSIDLDVLHFGTISPFDCESLTNIVPNYKHIVVLEEHIKSGGLGTRVVEELFRSNIRPKIYQHLCLENELIDIYGRQEEILLEFKLSPEEIIKRIKNKR